MRLPVTYYDEDLRRIWVSDGASSSLAEHGNAGLQQFSEATLLLFEGQISVDFRSGSIAKVLVESM